MIACLFVLLFVRLFSSSGLKTHDVRGGRVQVSGGVCAHGRRCARCAAVHGGRSPHHLHTGPRCGSHPGASSRGPPVYCRKGSWSYSAACSWVCVIARWVDAGTGAQVETTDATGGVCGGGVPRVGQSHCADPRLHSGTPPAVLLLAGFVLGCEIPTPTSSFKFVAPLCRSRPYVHVCEGYRTAACRCCLCPGTRWAWRRMSRRGGCRVAPRSVSASMCWIERARPSGQ